MLIVLVMRKRVELVAALFREAGKSVHAMPFLLIQPVWTLLSLIALCAGWIYAAIWIESAGVATTVNGSPVFFQKDTWLQVVRWYNILAALWLSQFCLACQNLIIAGAVANWFFTRYSARILIPSINETGRFSLTATNPDWAVQSPGVQAIASAIILARSRWVRFSSPSSSSSGSFFTIWIRSWRRRAPIAAESSIASAVSASAASTASKSFCRAFAPMPTSRLVF